MRYSIDRRRSCPPLDGSAHLAFAALRAMVDAWVKGFFHVTKLIKRLDCSEGDFLKEVRAEPHLLR